MTMGQPPPRVPACSALGLLRAASIRRGGPGSVALRASHTFGTRSDRAADPHHPPPAHPSGVRIRYIMELRRGGLVGAGVLLTMIGLRTYERSPRKPHPSGRRLALSSQNGPNGGHGSCLGEGDPGALPRPVRVRPTGAPAWAFRWAAKAPAWARAVQGPCPGRSGSGRHTVPARAVMRPALAGPTDRPHGASLDGLAALALMALIIWDGQRPRHGARSDAIHGSGTASDGADLRDRRGRGRVRSLAV